MRGRLAAVWCAAGVVAIGGCGDDGPTPAEQRAAKQRWVQRVDDTCAKANKAIAERGWPVDLVDLDRLVVRGVADARAAVETITALRIPEGAGSEARAFVAELRELRPALDELSAASEDLEPDALLRVADALKPRLYSLEQRAAAVGLIDCGSSEERNVIPDAIRAPVFAKQLGKLDRTLFRRIERLSETPARTPAAVADRYRRIGEVLDDNLEGLDTLEPPQWAARQTSRYQGVMLDLKGVVGKAHTLFDQGADALTLRKLDRLADEFRRVSRRERKARRQMREAVGAAPTTRAPQDPEAPAEPGDEIQS